mgnify:FL=1
MALGGVEIGRHMAADAERAIPRRIVDVPPTGSRLAPIPLQTTARIGTSSAAVAVFDMKLLRK